MNPADRYPLVLLGLFGLAFIALGVEPHYRDDWALESVLTVIVIPLLIATYRNLRFSNLAYTAFFIFMLFHTVGSHYTYTEVPAGFWVADAFGWERNHYDRLVHFLYGFLFAPMAVELFDGKAPARGVWRPIMPVLFLTSHKAIYEIIEWWAAEIFGGDLGVAYLGTQGDVWDAQKDMGLGVAGAIIGVCVYLYLCGRRRA